MNTRDLTSFRKSLIDWYRKYRRDLPWRRSADPYRIWVSEVMLQQTQVKTVLPFYHNFIERFPTPTHLARSSLQDVLMAWEGLGYYARARNLHKAAIKVVEAYDGAVPDTRKAFQKLPGVGDYIASAVLSIAFGCGYPVVDGNVKRLLARLFKIDAPVNRANSEKRFKETAARLLDLRAPGTFNQAMMELGALVCKPRAPLCDVCPVRRWCRAFQTRAVDQYPQRLKSRSIPVHHIAVGVIVKNGKVLITRRKPEGLLGGLWEFPGGKVGKGETAEAACAREIREEVNLEISAEAYLTRVKHAYTHFKIVMDVFRCRYVSGRVRLNGPVDHRWITPDRIREYPFPRANHKFIPMLYQMKTEC
jgi:A/G-specific adenine glycosylase